MEHGVDKENDVDVWMSGCGDVSSLGTCCVLDVRFLKYAVLFPIFSVILTDDFMTAVRKILQK